MAPWLRLGLRRAVGLIAAYALVLQATLAGAVLAHAATNPAGGFDPLSVLCVIDGGKAHAALPDAAPTGDEGPSHLGNHCGLCAVSGPVLAALIAIAIAQLAPNRSHIAAAATHQVARPAASALPGRPRAPPAIA